VTVPPQLSALSYDHLLGFRFAVNVLLATTIVWFTLGRIGDSNPIWAIASMVAAADPQPEEARRLFRSRLINVTVGGAVGLVFLVFGSGSERMIPAALAVTVLISTYSVRVKIMWRQASITASIVIAGGIAGGSARVESDAARARWGRCCSVAWWAYVELVDGGTFGWSAASGEP